VRCSCKVYSRHVAPSAAEGACQGGGTTAKAAPRLTALWVHAVTQDAPLVARGAAAACWIRYRRRTRDPRKTWSGREQPAASSTAETLRPLPGSIGPGTKSLNAARPAAILLQGGKSGVLRSPGGGSGWQVAVFSAGTGEGSASAFRESVRLCAASPAATALWACCQRLDCASSGARCTARRRFKRPVVRGRVVGRSWARRSTGPSTPALRPLYWRRLPVASLCWPRRRTLCRRHSVAGATKNA